MKIKDLATTAGNSHFSRHGNNNLLKPLSHFCYYYFYYYISAVFQYFSSWLCLLHYFLNVVSVLSNCQNVFNKCFINFSDCSNCTGTPQSIYAFPLLPIMMKAECAEVFMGHRWLQISLQKWIQYALHHHTVKLSTEPVMSMYLVWTTKKQIQKLGNSFFPPYFTSHSDRRYPEWSFFLSRTKL